MSAFIDPAAPLIGYRSIVLQSLSAWGFGAAGDGVTDDTAALQAWINAGGDLYLPAGNYMCDGLVITSVVNVTAHPNAVLMQRSGGNTNRHMIEWRGGASGSVWDGGQIDGRRSVHAAGRTDPNIFYSGFYGFGGARITVRNVRVRNMLFSPILHFAGADCTYQNILAEDCGKLMQAQNSSGFRAVGIVGRRIGNAGSVIWQCPLEIRGLIGFHLDDLRVFDYAVDAFARDTFTQGMSLEFNQRGTIGSVVLEGFAPGDYGFPCVGFTMKANRDVDIMSIVARGYGAGFREATNWNCRIGSLLLDGEYKVHDGGSDSGIISTSGGLSYDYGQQQDPFTFNSRANAGSRNTFIAYASVRRFSDNGVEVQNEQVAFGTLVTEGNYNHGIAFNTIAQNASYFPGAPGVTAARCAIGTLIAKNNGKAGINLNDAVDLTVGAAMLINNGQDSAALNVERSGVYTITDGDLARVAFGSIVARDDQFPTKAAVASFLPGSTDANNRFDFYSSNSNGWGVGQFITLRDAGGPSVNIQGRIYDMIADAITIQTTAPATFVSTGNTQALTGTVTTNGLILTGSGTAFTTQCRGPVYIRPVGGSDSDWRLVTKVNSDTELIIKNAFAAAHTGVAFERLTVDVAGVVSQQYGVTVRQNGGFMSWGSMVEAGNNLKPVHIENWLGLAPGQEAWVGSGNVNASTSGTGTTMFQNIPAGFVVLAWRFLVRVAVTGGPTSISLELNDDASLLATLATGIGVAKNSKSDGAVQAPVPFLTSNGNLIARAVGGTPSAGNYRLDLLVKRLLPETLPSVP